jgi:hypothetical protein
VISLSFFCPQSWPKQRPKRGWNYLTRIKPCCLKNLYFTRLFGTACYCLSLVDTLRLPYQGHDPPPEL